MSTPEYSDSKSIPHGKSTGGQEGRLDPGRRVYSGQYEAVSLQEATSRMLKRQNGKMDIIKGGVDDNDPALLHSSRSKKAEKKPSVKKPSAIENQERIRELAKAPESFDDFDSFSDFIPDKKKTEKTIPQEETGTTEFSSVPFSMVELADSITERIASRLTSEKEEPKKQHPFEKFLSKKCSLTVKLPNTTLVVQAICVLDDSYSLTVLFSTDSTMIFIPDPGSEVSISSNEEKATKCYFPGAKFTIPELKIMGLCFIKSPE